MRPEGHVSFTLLLTLMLLLLMMKTMTKMLLLLKSIMINGIKMYQVWSDQFMIPPNHVNVSLVSLCFLSGKKEKRTFRSQNGQVARGKTVMIAGHGAFGVENVGNAEVQTMERTGFSIIFWWEQQGSIVKGKSNPIHRWWFQALYFHPYLGKWSNLTNYIIFFRWVETTNLQSYRIHGGYICAWRSIIVWYCLCLIKIHLNFHYMVDQRVTMQIFGSPLEPKTFEV